LEEVKAFAIQLSSGNKLWRALAQQEITDKINEFHRDLDAAHRKFQVCVRSNTWASVEQTGYLRHYQ
jgi:hypothetical protein